MSILVVRHGQTEWSLSGQHTGVTDIPLTAQGEVQARQLAPVFAARTVAAVFTSPRQRARRTAELAGLTTGDVQVDANLVEWDYGAYEGRTTPEISEELGRPWSVWHDGVVPGDTPGETVHAVAARARAVLDRADAVTASGAEGDVVLVAHGHFLRVLLATWLGLSPTAGALFALDAGTWGELGHEHGRRVLQRWSVPPNG